MISLRQFVNDVVARGYLLLEQNAARPTLRATPEVVVEAETEDLADDPFEEDAQKEIEMYYYDNGEKWVEKRMDKMKTGHLKTLDVSTIVGWLRKGVEKNCIYIRSISINLFD